MRTSICFVIMALIVCCHGVGPESGRAAASEGIRPIGQMDSLYILPENIETRWASPENWKGEKGAGGQVNSGRKGSPCFMLEAGKSQVLAEVTGRSGTVRRIWLTINDRSEKMLRGIKIEMFWDGSTHPAVSAPLGDFFCHSLGRMNVFQSALFSSPEGRSFNCCIPMPFRTGMKIVATNETDTNLDMFFYDVDYTLGDKHGDEMLYFHAHYRRENPTTMQKDYELLPRVTGKGRYLGVNIGVIADTGTYFTTWWGEGEVKMYIDDDSEFPTLCGTGTEDYIGTGWGQGQYAHLYQGCHLADREKMQYGFYRWHIPDPVYFHKDIRITIHQIGCSDPGINEKLIEAGKPIYQNGKGLVEVDLRKRVKDYFLFERQDDWSSCAYFYLNTPENNLN
ncbi:MAG: DUF2961 domain-containing protein [Sedimentisphaerales bacterium]|nr:DUF2961 domain-containing protein [Sedimentisphaerales bacterium]